MTLTIKHTIFTKNGLEEIVLTPRKAIRRKCVNCCCYNTAEVRRCMTTHCALWPYRIGYGAPETIIQQVVTGLTIRHTVWGNNTKWDSSKLIEMTLTPRKAIRRRCIDCCGYNTSDVRDCTLGTCPIWPYRMGYGSPQIIKE